MAKIKKKKRLKLIPFLLFVLVITGTFFLVDVLLDTRIENIVIKGNKLVTDQQIIDEAGLSNYPSFYKTTSYNIKKALEKNSFIKEVKVKRSFYHVITIEVSEYKVLLKKETTGKLVLENMNEVMIGAGEATRKMSLMAETMKQEADGMRKINDNVAKVAEIVDNNSAASQETAAVSEEQSAQVQTMVHMMEKFNI